MHPSIPTLQPPRMVRTMPAAIAPAFGAPAAGVGLAVFDRAVFDRAVFNRAVFDRAGVDRAGAVDRARIGAVEPVGIPGAFPLPLVEGLSLPPAVQRVNP